MPTGFRLSEQWIKEFRRISRWTRNFRVIGGDFTNSPEGPTLRIPPESPERLHRPRTWLVKVTGNAGGNAIYTGRRALPPTSALNASSAATESVVATFPSSDDSYVINCAELGQATHDLTTGTPISKVFVGFLLAVTATDGKPVYAINGYDFKSCT